MSIESGGKLKLLVLASTYPRWSGDTEPGFVHELAKRLTGRFEVIVLCPHARGGRPAEILDGVRVYRYRYAPESLETLVNDGGIVTNLRRQSWKWLLVPGFIFMQLFEAWRLCRREGVDVVHAHWLIPQGVLAGVLNLFFRRRLPFVVTSHGADLYALRGPLLQRLKRWVLSSATSATVVSDAMREVAASMGSDTGKISVLPMGVNMQKHFVPDQTVPRSPSELLFVGRLVEKKGLTYLLDALPLILRERPDVTLTIAGFGPEEEPLRAKVSSLGLLDVVNFLGGVSQAELPPLYQRAALLVAPFVQANSGDQEGLGLVLVEAIGCGCPVLAGRVAAVADVLGDYAVQCIVDPRDPLKLASSVLETLNQPELAQERTMSIRKELIGRLDWKVVSQNYAETLSRACL